jgi:hypothetical protein
LGPEAKLPEVVWADAWGIIPPPPLILLLILFDDDTRAENPKIDPKAKVVAPAAINLRKSRRDTFSLNVTMLPCRLSINKLPLFNKSHVILVILLPTIF